MDAEDGPSPGTGEWIRMGDAEVLSGSPQPPRRSWPRWAVLAAAASALIVVLATQFGGRDAPGHSARPSASAQPTPPPPSADVAPPAASAVTVTDVGHPLLGISADWGLFARGPGALVHIEFTRGRLTRTVLPALASGGAVSFLAAPRAAIIRPWDFVPGYLVPDGAPPRALTGALASGGVLLPGPSPGTFWIQGGQGGLAAPMTLIGTDGNPIPPPHGARISIPSTMTSWPAPDGAGYLLATGLDGVYDLRPGRVERITSGAVLAVGPTLWLAAECTPQAQCSLVVIDHVTRTRRELRPFSGNPASVSGMISPDGRTAALLLHDSTASGPPLLHLIDLGSGADRVAVDFNQDVSASFDDALAWSPDSTWLFATDVQGQLRAVNPRTGATLSLGLPLPAVDQLAVR